MKIAIFDTETTGLPLPGQVPLARQPKIIEFGAVLIETATGEELASISQLLDPGEAIPEIITKITGITTDDVQGKPTFEKFLPIIVATFKQADAIVAHNAEFDTTMIKLELARLEVEDFPWPRLTVCTVQEFKTIMGYWPKLIDAYEHFTGEKLKQTHRALDDVRALIACCDAAGLFKTMADA